jgi:CDP-paratose synthetase
MKKILIVGGNGFLGKSLFDGLSESYRVVIASRSKSGVDILTYRDVNDLMGQLEKYEVYGIINCAVAYGRGDESDEELEDTNFRLPTRLAIYASHNNIKLFINCDSFYRSFSRGIANNKYIFYKKQTFNYLKALDLVSQTKIVSATIHHMYGPDDSLNKIISSVVDRLKKSQEVNLSACEQRRYFIDVLDVVKFFKEILANYDALKSFNEIDIAGDYHLSTKEIMCKLYDLIQCGSLNFDATLYHEIDKNIVLKIDSPAWLSIKQIQIDSSLKRLL